MSDLVDHLADQAAGLVLATPDPDLALPTPCREFDVAALLLHWLCASNGSRITLLEGGLPAEDAWGLRALGPDAPLQESLADAIAGLAEVMGRDGITEGETRWGLPQLVVWRIAVAELALHAWDLARATGRDVVLDHFSQRFVLDAVAAIQRGHRLDSLFGPPLPAPPDASPFERALCLSGRDPAWAWGR